MQTKICSKCKIEKEIIQFRKSKTCKFGVTSVCKECLKSPKTKRKEQLPVGFKICTKCDKEKPVSSFGIDNSSKDRLLIYCKECIKEISKNYYSIHKKEIAKIIHKSYLKNKEKRKLYRDTHKEQRKEWCLKNKEKIKKRRNVYIKNNKKQIRLKHNKWLTRKRKENINFKILSNLRTRLGHAIRGNSKSKRTLEMLGCDIDFLKQHLESQFTESMSWDNHSFSGWHIDHIYPCASFDLSKPEEQEICFNWSNLQPLWADDNFKKNKY